MEKIRNKKRIFNEKTLLTTIDIGKETNYGYMRCYDGMEVAPFDFKNKYHGFTKFWKSVKYLKKEKDLTHVIVGIESTLQISLNWDVGCVLLFLKAPLPNCENWFIPEMMR